jgi:2',5'-phosphodiesterase
MQGLPPKASCSNEIESLWRDDLPALKSAYAQYDNDKHPEFTNFVSDFSGTLDYIFHSQDLTTIRIAEVLTHEEASREGCLPSSVQPSDHLPLVAVVQ